MYRWRSSFTEMGKKPNEKNEAAMCGNHWRAPTFPLFFCFHSDDIWSRVTVSSPFLALLYCTHDRMFNYYRGLCRYPNLIQLCDEVCGPTKLLLLFCYRTGVVRLFHVPASLPQRLVPAAARPERPRGADLRAGRLRRLVGALRSNRLFAVVQPQEMPDAAVASRGRFRPPPPPAVAATTSPGRQRGVFRSFGRCAGQPPTLGRIVGIRTAPVQLDAALGRFLGRVVLAVVHATPLLPVTS